MKWIYIVTIVLLGGEIPCPSGLKHCDRVHIGNDTVHYYYCTKSNAVEKYMESRFQEKWLKATNGLYPTYALSRKLDSIQMTQRNIDSLNKLKP